MSEKSGETHRQSEQVPEENEKAQEQECELLYFAPYTSTTS